VSDNVFGVYVKSRDTWDSNNQD